MSKKTKPIPKKNSKRSPSLAKSPTKAIAVGKTREQIVKAIAKKAVASATPYKDQRRAKEIGDVIQEINKMTASKGYFFKDRQ
jgi:hypothetical protein